MLACAPGEQHDIGLLMLAVMLRADGWRVEFLGADTPVDDADRVRRARSTRRCSASAPPAAESLEALRELALRTAGCRQARARDRRGAVVTPEIARELRATYADGELDLAVARLRKLSAG